MVDLVKLQKECKEISFNIVKHLNIKIHEKNYENT